MITRINDFKAELIGKENMFFNIDCMDLLKKMPDKSISLAIVDPPYGINITGRHKAKVGASPLVGGGQTVRRYAEVTVVADPRSGGV
jgi:DNA modification methylase